VPRYYDASLWKSVSARSPPIIGTHKIIQPAEGTDQVLGTATESPTDPTETTVVNEGTNENDELLKSALQFHAEQGRQT
jgi:hypothetical protein